MSLLLDALKRAAEKNAKKGRAKKDVVDEDESLYLDKTEVDDKTEYKVESEEQTEFTRQEITKTEIDMPTQVDSGSVTEVSSEPTQTIVDDDEDQTEIINIPNDAITSVEFEDEKVLQGDDPVEVLQNEEDQTLAQTKSPKTAAERGTPYLKEVVDDEPFPELEKNDLLSELSLSNDQNEELTDDDVTAFLGGANSFSITDFTLEKPDPLSEFSFSMDDDETEKKAPDGTITSGLNLVELPADMDDDSTMMGDNTSTTSRLGQTTSLNSLTNESTVTTQDATSRTFASDNYDRTLVKLEGDVSKVFTGMKSEQPGEAMTPDFAKKIFVSKSSSLRRQHFKLYLIIALVLFVSVSLFAMYELQSQMETIDTGLVRLKQNPVPAKLRYKKPKVEEDDLSVLNGKVDTEALKLLKTMADQVSTDPANETTDVAADNKQVETTQAEVVEGDTALTNNSKEAMNEEIAANEEGITATDKVEAEGIISSDKEKPVARKKSTKVIAKKDDSPIIIRSKTSESKESKLLSSAYGTYQKGNIALAEKQYQNVLSENENNRDALLGLAAIYANQNRSELAIANYQKILLENPKDSLAMTSLIAASSLSPVESESRLKIMQRENPNATYLQFALGNVISAQNRWEEAQQFYFAAYQADPNNPVYAYNLGVSLDQLKKPSLAVTYYQQAIENAKQSSASFNVELIKERIEVLQVQ